jgi:hypothetical protein
MNWGEWIDLTTVKALSQHASGTLAALSFFALVRLALALVDLLVTLSSTTRTILRTLDEFVLVGLFLWLIYQMACFLWKGRIKNASTNLVMVA